MSRRKQILFAFLTLALMLAVMELFARLVIPEDEPVVPTKIGRFDPLLGWSLQPGASGVSMATGRAVEYRINAQGLRGDETPIQKLQGIFRILLVGDSRSFGFGVPIEQHFSHLLEGYFKNVEVINLGVGGYGVDQELLSLRYNGLKFAPDLVIAYVAHYGDHRHMYTVRFGKSKPAFVLKGGQLELINSPVPSPSSWETIYNIMSLSKIVRLVGELRNPHPLIDEKRADAEALRNEDYRHALLELGEAIVFAMAEESWTHGAKFLLVTQMEQLENAERARGLNVLNVSAILGNPSYVLPRGLQHFNEAGNGALAWELARFLKDSGLIPPEHFRAFAGPRY
jgi:hypothetical protein